VGDLTIHELIWGYIGALGVLAGFFAYAWKKQWPQRVWGLWIRFLIKIKVIKPPPDPTDAHMRIKKMLIELRTKTNADRAHVVQFHNGDYYDNNSSIKRFTYCYEDMKDGISSIQEKYQRRLVSGYIEGLDVLVNGDNTVNKLRASDMESCLYKGKMLEDGIIAQIGIPLRHKFSGIPRIIGYILLSYNKDRVPEKCAFNGLMKEGHFINSDTDSIVERQCSASCKDCSFHTYIPQFEHALSEIK